MFVSSNLFSFTEHGSETLM